MAAFISNNAIARSELPALFEGLHATLKRLGEGREIVPAVIEPTAPAVSIRKSITPDYLICLDDGKQFKSLRRHLAKLGMTPEQYRAKWSLPSSYPMVATNYSAQRSALAKSVGLGHLRRKPIAASSASLGTTEAVAPEPASVPKSKAKAKTASKIEAAEATPGDAVKRKRGRPDKTTV